jgi:hypothetical protein
MSISKLKKILNEMDNEEIQDSGEDNSIEVIADTVQEALDIASAELGIDVNHLDYTILQRGTKGFLGFGKTPFRLLITQLSREAILEGLEDDLNMPLEKLESLSSPSLDGTFKEELPKDMDGYAKVRIYKSGIWLWVYPPLGKGKKTTIDETLQRIVQLGISKVDMNLIEKIVKASSGQKVKIGDWKPNPEMDSSVYLEMSEDEMMVFAHITPPRGAGRHLEYEDIMRAMDAKGVVACVNELAIKKCLDDAAYGKPLEAASGIKPKHGKDAAIEYKVRISKEIKLEEDESGRVDFTDLDLVENVVAGQVLAVKVPPEQGIPGRTVTNKMLEAKNGRDGQIRHGKGTILSDDGLTLTAEINGEVIYSFGKISVQPVKTIHGDVGTSTGNIIFLGSVVVIGSVQDNFSVKAAGNIEIRDSVQKAHLEAEGDIIIRGGIQGREEGYIESTGGNVYAKFIQGAKVVTENDIYVSEGILHSRLDAGGKVICNGKRAQIVGGAIRARTEVRAKTIGSESFTKTEIRVGYDPKLLQRMQDLEKTKIEIDEKLEKADQTIKYLTAQKAQEGEKFSQEKSEKLERLIKGRGKFMEKIGEIQADLAEIKQYLVAMDQTGKVSVEKTIWPNVSVYIQEASLTIRDEYNHVTLIKRENDVAIVNYDEDQKSKKKRPPASKKKS